MTDDTKTAGVPRIWLGKTMTFQIDDNIPLPEICQRKRGPIYPFHDLEVGQSFFVDRNEKGFGPTVYAAAKRSGMKFALRSVTENGVAGVRVWRTE